MRSCARRSFAAATSFIARVIFCVDWTERIRRWMSRSVAMRPDLRGLDALRRGELRLGFGHRRRQRIARRVRELLAVADLGEDLRRAALEPGVEEGLELADRVDRQIVEESLRTREDDDDLLLDRQRLVLPLLEELDHALTPRELHLRGAVQVGAELRERGQLPVLGEVEPQLARDLPHRPHLSRAAHPRDREADIDGWANTAVEEVGLQVDLAVRDRDHV